MTSEISGDIFEKRFLDFSSLNFLSRDLVDSALTTKTSNIRHIKPQNLNVIRLVVAVVFAQSIEAKWQVENEDVVGAAPTGDAPTRPEWSTILSPTDVRLILEVWVYICFDTGLI